MRITAFVAVGAVIDIPEKGLPIPVAQNPLDELTARLRGEASCGRDSVKPGFTLPDVTACMIAAFQECPDRN
jgi:hypothetical protein